MPVRGNDARGSRRGLGFEVALVATSLVALSSAWMLWWGGALFSVEARHTVAVFATTCLAALVTLAGSLLGRRWSRGLALCSGLVAATAAACFAGSLWLPPREAVEIREGPAAAPLSAPDTLRIVQLNVLHGFPRFPEQEQRSDRLVDSLRRIEADVLVLQEVWKARGHGDLAERLSTELGMWGAYAKSNGSLPRLGFEEGSAVFSRFPILSAERWVLEPAKGAFEHRIALRVELDLGDRTESVVGVHLANRAPEVARAQADDLRRRLAGDRPLVIGGDFNLEANDPGVSEFSQAGYTSVEPAGIDHLLVGDVDGWRARWSAVVLRPGEADAGSVSDHPAILVELASLREPRASAWQGEWTVREPSALGFDAQRLERAAERIGAMEGVGSLLVVREGGLVLERYFRGASAGRLHNLKSASKSVLSAVVGIAVEEGLLDLDVPISKLLPGTWADEEGKDSILVRHLLSMTSGLESTSFRSYGSWVASRDWVRGALERDLVAAPGTRFSYSTGSSHLLSALLTEATGKSTLDFARERLFEPLGIGGVSWARDPRGIYVGGNNMAMTPRDMARFGLLYLDRGRWGERQIVPARWVDVSTSPVARTRRGGGYGYLWWMRPPEERGAYYASGYGGQYIYVAPSAGLVIVITSTEASKGRRWRQELFAEVREGIIGSLPERYRVKTPAAPMPWEWAPPGREVAPPGTPAGPPES